MREETSTKNKINTVTLTILFFSLIFACLCLLIPVWQSSENNRMRSRLNAYQSEMDKKEEVKMILESEVAEKSSPESLMAFVKDNNISLMPISSQKGFVVASNW